MGKLNRIRASLPPNYQKLYLNIETLLPVSQCDCSDGSTTSTYARLKLVTITFYCFLSTCPSPKKERKAICCLIPRCHYRHLCSLIYTTYPSPLLPHCGRAQTQTYRCWGVGGSESEAKRSFLNYYCLVDFL